MRNPGPVDWLWAPWRMAFIRKARKQAASGECFFCTYAREKKHDRKNLVVHRGRRCLVLMNLYPYTTGHLLIAPTVHKGRLADLTRPERSELFDLLVRAQEALDRTIHPDGYNAGINLGTAAGAGVPGHLHLHLVPRWTGDANFMTTAGNARVMPGSLRSLHGPLQKAMRSRR